MRVELIYSSMGICIPVDCERLKLYELFMKIKSWKCKFEENSELQSGEKSRKINCDGVLRNRGMRNEMSTCRVISTLLDWQRREQHSSQLDLDQLESRTNHKNSQQSSGEKAFRRGYFDVYVITMALLWSERIQKILCVHWPKYF